MLQRRLKWHFDQFSCFCKEHRHTVTVSCILCYAYWCWLKIHQVSKSPSILGRHKVQLRLQMFTVGDGRVQLFVIIFTWSLPLLQQSTQFARLSYNKADSTSPGKPVSYTFNKSMFSYLHALKMWHCPHLLLHGMLRPCAAAAPAAQQSIDISYLLGPQQQTCHMLLQRTNGTDKRTDGRTSHHFIDYVGSVTKSSYNEQSLSNKQIHRKMMYAHKDEQGIYKTRRNNKMSMHLRFALGNLWPVVGQQSVWLRCNCRLSGQQVLNVILLVLSIIITSNTAPSLDKSPAS